MTLTRRASPSSRQRCAAFLTAPRAQPPPTQPAIRPSAAMIALTPGLAATEATVRTTVANTKGSPFAASSSANLVTSSLADIAVLLRRAPDAAPVQPDSAGCGRAQTDRHGAGRPPCHPRPADSPASPAAD